MNVYYMFMEAKPSPENSESKEYSGAYINCWVHSENETEAINKAVEYVDEEGWKVLSIDEISITERERNSDEESLECFDQAVSFGVDAIFYTWPLGSEDE